MLFGRLQNSILSWELVTSKSSSFSEVSGEKNPFFCKFWEDSHFTANAEMGKNTCLPSNDNFLLLYNNEKVVPERVQTSEEMEYYPVDE